MEYRIEAILEPHHDFHTIKQAVIRIAEVTHQSANVVRIGAHCTILCAQSGMLEEMLCAHGVGHLTYQGCRECGRQMIKRPGACVLCSPTGR